MNILINKYYINLFLYWIITLISLIIIMIIVGGLTRLTDSGLSITSWDLFKGIIPPLNKSDWLYYFSLYKEIPQFNLLFPDMSLKEFKYIFLWEYFHRLLGRLIGITFLIPLLFLIYKKALSKEYLIKLNLLFFFLFFQGFLGWFMVESGLIDDVTVSHYRLALHLFFAFIIFSSLVWILLNFLRKKNNSFFNSNNNFFSIKIFIFFIFLQIIIGAFVSGLDAGKIYQSWPLMNQSYFPDDLNFFKIKSYKIFDNPSFVQFFHRNADYVIFGLTLYIGFLIFRFKKYNLYIAYSLLLFVVFIQIILGVATLLSGLNILIASFHQISSILLVFLSLNLYHKSI